MPPPILWAPETYVVLDAANLGISILVEGMWKVIDWVWVELLISLIRLNVPWGRELILTVNSKPCP